MVEFNKVMRSVGDATFVVRCGMRESLVSPDFYMKCDALGSGSYPEDTGIYTVTWGTNHPMDLITGQLDGAYRTDTSDPLKALCSVTPFIDLEKDVGSWTIAFWTRISSTTPIPLQVLTENYSSGFLQLVVSDFGEVLLRYLIGGSNEVRTNLSTGVWQYIAVVKDAPGGSIKLYVNDVEKDSVTGLSFFSQNAVSCEMFANTQFAGSGNRDIDEIKIFKSALTEIELTALFESY